MSCHVCWNGVTDYDFRPVAYLIQWWYKCCNWQAGCVENFSKILCLVSLISKRQDREDCQKNLSRFLGFLQYVTFKVLMEVTLMGERRGVYRVLVGELEVKRPLGGPRRRWEDNIKMDLQEVRCGGHGMDRARLG